jgi:hypothetical protein
MNLTLTAGVVWEGTNLPLIWLVRITTVKQRRFKVEVDRFWAPVSSTHCIL